MTASPDTPYGAVERLSPLLRRVLARNPSPMTESGTGTLIVGHRTVAVIDPGPDLIEHHTALLRAIDGERVSHVVLTHRHQDHAGLARAFADAVGAPIAAFGPLPQPESFTIPIAADLALDDGDMLDGPGWRLEAIHTPGHASDHLCFALIEEATLLSGDHVMGWNTTVVIPPDGDMQAYETSLDRVRTRDERLYRPTHGAAVAEGPVLARNLLAHRRGRERSILARLAEGAVDRPGLVAAIYPTLAPALVPMAGLTIEAHLIKLEREDRVARDGTVWHLTGR